MFRIEEVYPTPNVTPRRCSMGYCKWGTPASFLQWNLHWSYWSDCILSNVLLERSVGMSRISCCCVDLYSIHVWTVWWYHWDEEYNRRRVLMREDWITQTFAVWRMLCSSQKVCRWILLPDTRWDSQCKIRGNRQFQMLKEWELWKKRINFWRESISNLTKAIMYAQTHIIYQFDEKHQFDSSFQWDCFETRQCFSAKTSQIDKIFLYPNVPFKIISVKQFVKQVSPPRIT